MTSTTTLTPLSATCQNGSLSEKSFENSDELMLEELERRDGIYSFIFHELESPKGLKNTESEIIQNRSPLRNGHRNSLSSRIYYKNLSQQLENAITPQITENTIVQSNKNTISISSLTNKSSTGETNITSSSSAPIVSSTTRDSFKKLPKQNELFCYQQYFKTWYPPPPTPPVSNTRQMNFMKTSSTISNSAPFYLNKNPTNLYVCMMNCGVSVRPQPPRFSHITEPLIRNRRHALKESEEYKQWTNLHALRAPDLRSLFPHDPDVHAPFLKERNGALGCLKAEADIKSDENQLLPTCSEIKS